MCQVVFGKIYMFRDMAIVSNLEPLSNFQAQSTVFVFIQTSPYVELIVHLKLFLESQPK